MKLIPLEGSLYDKALNTLKDADLFSRLKPDHIKQVMKYAGLISYEDQDIIIQTGDAADCFYILIEGQARVFIELDKKGLKMEVGSHKKADIIGEIGLLLNKKRSATVIACQGALALRFDKKVLPHAIEKIPGFQSVLNEVLAYRLYNLSGRFPRNTVETEPASPDKEALSFLPINFIIRHRALPLKSEGDTMTIGFVDYPNPAVISSIEKFIPGMEIKSVKVPIDFFDEQLKGLLAKDKKEKKAKGRTYQLNELLERMVEEGASDLHLSADQEPCWRIDGRIVQIKDSRPFSEKEAWNLFEPLLNSRQKSDFERDYSLDFAHSINNARFRINLYHDYNGVNAAIRMIPSNVLSFEQLGLPNMLTKLCDNPNGIVLVTGPTGCGKTTTLACLINHINENYDNHIITLEDPIEYLHKSKKCLINQRELNTHIRSFKDGLRFALREDPDVILVGEMRDYETISLALEASNTGHLVFATLHTPTAVSTIERIIQVFPSEQQNKIRSLLADNIRGILCQAMCRKIRGGRIPALEVLIVNPAIANMIRESKLTQIPSAMQTSKAQGNVLLNEYLANLVSKHKITPDEALKHAIDKQDLKKRI